jgi:hypothetical protein
MDMRYMVVARATGGPIEGGGGSGEGGVTPDISIEVVSLPWDSEPTVTESGSLAAPTFTIGIPQGQPGESVKSSEEENKIAILEDGTMSINEVDIEKITQDEDDFLILDGGRSN